MWHWSKSTFLFIFVMKVLLSSFLYDVCPFFSLAFTCNFFSCQVKLCLSLMCLCISWLLCRQIIIMECKIFWKQVFVVLISLYTVPIHFWMVKDLLDLAELLHVCSALLLVLWFIQGRSYCLGSGGTCPRWKKGKFHF